MKKWILILLWRIVFGSGVWHKSNLEHVLPLETGAGQSMRLKAAMGEACWRGMLLDVCLDSSDGGQVLRLTQVIRASASGNIISVSTKTT
jgi:hypothetical protein